MSQLLLVEDDSSLGETLRERLEIDGHQVHWAQNLTEAREAALQKSFELIVLDVNLPDGSGFDFAREVKTRSTTPFLFITAMNSAEHRLEGYEIGAEEFIPKPFHLKELLLRVRHVLKTHALESTATNLLSIGDRKVDLAAQAVILPGGEKEFLASRDFQLLKLLVDSAPRAVSRDEILDQLFGEDKNPNHRTVDNAVVRLRQAIGDSSGQMIRSVRGVGYQWTGQ